MQHASHQSFDGVTHPHEQSLGQSDELILIGLHLQHIRTMYTIHRQSALGLIIRQQETKGLDAIVDPNGVRVQ